VASDVMDSGTVPARIRVAIVDDHPALREGAAVLLERQGDIEVVASLDTVTAVWGLIESGLPLDVVILDVRLGEERGLDLLARLSNAGRTRPAVVIWTGFDLPQYASFALRAGAAGFVLKMAPLEELVAAIRAAAAGGLYFGRIPAVQPGTLSLREREIVGLVIAGRSNDEIASQIGITSRSIEAHLTRLFERFGVASRTELATRALREAWLDVPAEAPAAGARAASEERSNG
jgi:DNA-binding NarL/FixJ family response regulator